MIGNFLRTAREKKGLTLKDVEADTSIRMYYLEALEREEYHLLPGKAYVKGFLRSYAEAIGLDADDVLQRYREEQDIYAEDSSLATENTSESAGVFASGEDFKARMSNAPRTRSLLTIVSIICLIFVGSVYYFFGDDDTHKNMVSTGNKEVATHAKDAQKGKAISAENGTKNDAPLGANPAASGLVLGAKLTNNCWLQVIADGKVIHESTGKSGDAFTFQAKEKMTITAGNAGAIEVTFNDRKMGFLGKPGEVVEKIFDKNGEVLPKKKDTPSKDVNVALEKDGSSKK